MKLLRGLFFLIASSKLMAAPLSIDSPWDAVSDPLQLEKNLVRTFSSLPLSGEIRNKRRLWSGDYWPLRKGSINYRWFRRKQDGFNLNSPDREKAQRLSIPELAELSPAEKYDLFTGRYDYPLKAQVERYSSPRAPLWEGICHGWAPASLNHDEPRPKLVLNPQGIEIPFGSTDIKALLSYYYANGFITAPVQMGTRCYPGSGDGCGEDLNAGAFHLILANRLGLRGESFIADIESRGEVWNNPAYRYVSQVLRELSPYSRTAAGAVRVLRIRTDFYFSDNGSNDWRPVIGTPLQEIKSRRYEYDLELNSSGEIIGGEWRSRERPDFLWLKERPLRFTGLLFRLGELLE